MDQLSEEQLDEIRLFVEGTGQIMFSNLQGAYIAEWMMAKTTDEREECWRMLQAAMRLQSLLRDASAMNVMNRRARYRLYERTTKGV